MGFLVASKLNITDGSRAIEPDRSEEIIPVQKSLAQKVWAVVEGIFWTIAILFDPITDFFTQALSDFLGLETLRHGTSIQNYISIRINGADPTKGGNPTGASSGCGDDGYIEKSKNYFYVTKDSESYTSFFGTIGSHVYNRWISSRLYCGVSASTTISGKGVHKTLLRIPIVAFNILVTPTVKFRFSSADISDIFENDPDNACEIHENRGVAYRTKQAISTDHIGLKGVLTQGLKDGIGKRMKAHPGKVTWGLVKLINPIGIPILLGLGTYLASRACCRGIKASVIALADKINSPTVAAAAA